MRETEAPKKECDHNFIFLRQERCNVSLDRNPCWLIEDVFHCSRCLAYKRVSVEKQFPINGSFDHRIERLV
jgi:hypothetical protein